MLFQIFEGKYESSVTIHEFYRIGDFSAFLKIDIFFKANRYLGKFATYPFISIMCAFPCKTLLFALT